jgi:predicted Fe-Mo cluster-binding NifX family protein
MNPTCIAIGTSDGRNVCDHLAHSASFVVIEIDGGALGARAVRDRFSEGCGNHAGFVEMLQGCDAVICGGIGQGAWDSLIAAGIRPLVLAGPMTVEDAAAGYVAGTLATTGERVCLCSH